VELRVERDVFGRFPGLQLAVAVARGLDNVAGRPAVAAAWARAREEEAAAAAAHGRAQAHPRMRLWRERRRVLGDARGAVVEADRPVGPL
jgi:DNA/RNA-binding domain of Phe-tRNA-synthetase-like protein